MHIAQCLCFDCNQCFKKFSLWYWDCKSKCPAIAMKQFTLHWTWSYCRN